MIIINERYIGLHCGLLDLTSNFNDFKDFSVVDNIEKIDVIDFDNYDLEVLKIWLNTV